MQINRTDNLSHSNATSVRDLQQQSKAASSVSQGNTRPNAGRLSSALPELKRLLNELQDTPEVRDDVVAAARERLAQGDYMTSAAAEQTAQALLGKDA